MSNWKTERTMRRTNFSAARNERKTCIGKGCYLLSFYRCSTLGLILAFFSLSLWVRNDDLLVFELSAATGSLSDRYLTDTDSSNDEKLLLSIGDWVRDNGGYINDKVAIRRINDHMTGMIATKDMDKGETICKIPKNVILNPNSVGNNLRGSRSKCNRINGIYDIITKDQNLLNPYERYLATRTAKAHHHLPLFWSSEAKELLKQLLGQIWDRGQYYEDLEEFRKKCWPEKYKTVSEMDERILDAIAIAHVRYEAGNNFIPWYDVINHANGPDWTADNRRGSDGSFELFTTRKVQAGEQLAMSYDQQSTGYGDNYDSLDYLFGYGFVPTLPQKWILDLSQNGSSKKQLKFTVDYKDRRSENKANDLSEVKVIFHQGTERHATISDIQNQIERLVKFDLEHKDMTDIPENEKYAIRQLYSSMVTASNQILRELHATPIKTA